ncbi:chorismate--pyruvate lyase family protein [Fastidiosibacter lacustris]|uniref:chorismate--pyruvate lyase family protein n=1 Tax=Fastidiosibacter lacustris TaxID=2056695 RepID=UPI000E342399|nr:chorismate lyase [Fastidiosibacter lacustris]
MINTWKTKQDLELDPNLEYWLFSVKRLGSTLAHYAPFLELSCINEYDGKIDDDELLLLNQHDKNCRIRLIKHHRNNEVLVFGRTVIPKETYLSYQNLFDTLGNNSIGEHFLFRESNIKRSDFYAWYCPADIVKHKLQLPTNTIDTPLWVRASIFELPNKQKLLIEEFFIELFKLN